MSFTIFQNDKTPCQAIRTRSSKTRNIDIFPKGLTHGFRPKMVILPNLCLQAKQARKLSFAIFYNENTSFQAIKIKNKKSRKIDIFPKWLTHGFGPKMVIFPTLFFCNIGQKKCLVRYFTTKKLFSRLKKTKSSKKSKNSHFSKGDKPLFWSKNGLFFQLFFLGNISKENVFDDIQERKNSFLGYKNKKFQKSKN